MERESLAEVLQQVVYAKRNTKHRNLFLEAIKDLKPAGCEVKIGWTSGSDIAFDCLFYKHGDSDIFDAIEKGVDNADEIVFFIYGLNPKVFHFYPDMAFDELKPDTFFLRFKLKRDATT